MLPPAALFTLAPADVMMMILLMMMVMRLR
jgi:hypothetical protein